MHDRVMRFAVVGLFSCGGATAAPVVEVGPPVASVTAAPTASAVPSTPVVPPAPPPVATGPAPFCTDGHPTRPCIFQLQGHCYEDRAPNTDWIEKPCTPPPPLGGDACRRVNQCRGISDEGCCVACNNPMRTRISAVCAKKIEAATDCAAVDAAASAKGCEPPLHP